MDEASCVGRSKTDLGSSLQYPATQGLGQFQDSNPAYNPGQSNFQLFVEVFCFSSTDQTRPAGRPAGQVPASWAESCMFWELFFGYSFAFPS